MSGFIVIDVHEFVELVAAEIGRVKYIDVGEVELSLDSRLIEDLRLDHDDIAELVLRLESFYRTAIAVDAAAEAIIVRDLLRLVEHGR